MRASNWNQGSIYSNPRARFTLSANFLAVIRTIPGVPPSKTIFTHDEVADLTSKYILRGIREQRSLNVGFIDIRNISIISVDGDPLGTAFNVKAFHRTQILTLIRSQLTLVPDPLVQDPSPALPSADNDLNPDSPEAAAPPQAEYVEPRTSEDEEGAAGFEYDIEHSPSEDERPEEAGGSNHEADSSLESEVNENLIVDDVDPISHSHSSENEVLEASEAEAETSNAKPQEKYVLCYKCHLTAPRYPFKYCLRCWAFMKEWRPKHRTGWKKRTKGKRTTTASRIQADNKAEVDGASPNTEERKKLPDIPEDPNLCSFCCVKPKDTTFIHGRIGHQISCYKCAKIHWRKRARCPVCRRVVEKIVKNFIS